MTDQPDTLEAERAQAQIAAVLALYGERLDSEQHDILRQQIERLRHLAAQLDPAHLENGDEPDFAFRAVDRADLQ